MKTFVFRSDSIAQNRVENLIFLRKLAEVGQIEITQSYASLEQGNLRYCRVCMPVTSSMVMLIVCEICTTQQASLLVSG